MTNKLVYQVNVFREKLRTLPLKEAAMIFKPNSHRFAAGRRVS
ncbi:hypothetical protein RintRC_4587 [Richelia intracellularis]|nr:hypothetical protein RintRC_4587 [Richelia intracellularis]